MLSQEAMATPTTTRSLSLRHDLTPILYMKPTAIQGIQLDRALLGLADSGSTATLVNKKCLPFGVVTLKGPSKFTTTTNGTYTSCERVTLQNLKFPEFGNRSIGDVQADLFDVPNCRYDIILGRTELRRMGMSFSFLYDTVTWLGRTIPMKTTYSLDTIPDTLAIQEEELLISELFASDIRDRKYDAVTPEEASAALKHLELKRRLKFKILFTKYKDVFDGKLGCHPTAKTKIKLKPGSKPHWRKPYSVPFARRKAFRRELDSLIRDGVLVRIGTSAWELSSFIIPKKDLRVRWVSDFRILNEMILREPHTLPRIQDIMNGRSRYTCFPKIDHSMMFYCFILDD